MNPIDSVEPSIATSYLISKFFDNVLTQCNNEDAIHPIALQESHYWFRNINSRYEGGLPYALQS